MLLAAVMLFAAACGLLADWQLHRLAGRHARNHLIRDNLHAPVTPVARSARRGPRPRRGARMAPVRASGHWDVAHQLLVRLRPYEGDVGFYVITPLVTGAGPAVLVNRGWVPAGEGGGERAPHPGTADRHGHGDRPAAPQRAARDRRNTATPQITRIDVPGIATHAALRRLRRLPRTHPAAARAGHARRGIPPARAERRPAPALRRAVGAVRADGLRRVRRARPPGGRRPARRAVSAGGDGPHQVERSGCPDGIEDYALIGDLQTAALVGRDGSIDWLCLPRFDSAGLLRRAARRRGATGTGGSRRAAGGTCTHRRYRGDTLVLETELGRRRDGTVRVIDFMPDRGEAPDVVRIVEGVAAGSTMRSELRLRFDYGRVVPWVRQPSTGMLAASPARTRSGCAPGRAACTARLRARYADFTVEAGERGAVRADLAPVAPAPARRRSTRYEALDADRGASGRVVGAAAPTRRLPRRRLRSLITLKALTYAPTGGIVAAPTTSLPEEIGGAAQLGLPLLLAARRHAHPAGAGPPATSRRRSAWREWLLRAVAGDPADLQIMYGVAGERRLPELELPWLPGYEGSHAGPDRQRGRRPAPARRLRRGHRRAVPGPARRARPRARTPGRCRRGLMEFLERHWREPDEGLWEVRGGRQHFVHSKVMAWVAARPGGAHASEQFGLRRRRSTAGGRCATRSTPRCCAKGFDAERNTFTQSYGSRELDAALLLIPQVGFLPPDDPRVLGTSTRSSAELRPRRLRLPLRHRRRRLDGRAAAATRARSWPARSGWPTRCALTAGTTRRASCSSGCWTLRNDVGLLAEEYDSRRAPAGQLPAGVQPHGAGQHRPQPGQRPRPRTPRTPNP